MIINIIIINSRETWLELIIFIIPVIIIIIGSGFILKWYDKKPQETRGIEIRNNTDRKLSKIFLETSENEMHFSHIKEIINQIIHQRSLVSRIKIEAQSFEEMIKTKHNFYESDYRIIQKRIEELDNLINNINHFKEKKHSDFNEFTAQMLASDHKILNSVRASSAEIIQITQSLDYNKYIEITDSIENDNKALIDLYQTLTLHIQEAFNRNNKES